MTAYLISMATFVGFFMILALALNMQWGMTGMVNFGIAGFYALGAYTSGLLTAKAGWPVGLAIPMAAVTGLFAGTLVALMSIRLREDFLAIVTLGFGEVVRLIALNEDQITEGPRGLKIDARPFAGMFDRESYPLVYLALVAAVVALTFFVAERIRRAPLGRTLRAIREDDVVAEVLGKNVLFHRVTIFAIGSAFMGVAGALYAHYVQNISPEVFMPMVAIFIWMSVIVGGAGNNWGLLAGAGIVSSIRIILIGALLIIILRVRPRGLLPEPRFTYKGNRGVAVPAIGGKNA
jgi:branched-chain amino acid transport system permease protein